MCSESCSPKRVMVFTVAVNYYDKVFSQNISSQRNYASRCGYEYYCFSTDRWLDKTVAAWLKIALINEWLARDYDYVMFIDADCFVAADTPRFECVLKTHKHVYLAKGFSGRVNSGMMILRNSKESKGLIWKLLVNCESRVAGADWGENGHVIYYTNNQPWLEVLDRCWNNNTFLDMSDFIRHYCAGTPFRERYPFQLMEQYYYTLLKLRLKYRRVLLRIGGMWGKRKPLNLKAQLVAEMDLFQQSIDSKKA
ncbi:MAG: hypothetical protein COB04_05790 [Gammaproteobacteria bacterium]|nr:MAG: hypothetical protein COB04_05790 [Gammaproteobacteria bacterium]